MLIRELIQASRQLRRTPGYTIVAVATLSLGLASTVTMFTAVNAAFLRALPFPEEEPAASRDSRAAARRPGLEP